MSTYQQWRRRIVHSTFAGYLREARRSGYVVMFHVGRSGSTVVADLLGQHPLIGWDDEVYQRIFRKRERPDSTLPAIDDVDAVDFLFQRARRVKGRYYGFEVKFFHLRALGTELAPYLDALERRARRVHYIVLERRNTLRKVVSGMVAQSSGTWHIPSDTPATRHQVHVDPQHAFVDRESRPLLEWLDGYAHDFRTLRDLLADRHALYLTYEEDVLRDPRRAFARICGFLDVPVHDVDVKHSRTNPYALKELILNYDEVMAALRGSPYEWMLD